MRLSSSTYGVSSGTPIVLLHGFTQTSGCWGPFGELLAENHPVVAVDLPGHGHSAALHADLPTSADLLAATIEELPSAPIVIGYSLGGRIALHLGIRHPDLIAGLIVIGATGGIDDELEREQRRHADEALAERLERIGVPAFIDEWLAQPLFASLDRDRSCRDERLSNSVPGLAASLRLSGTGTQEPLWSHLSALTMPVLVVAGETDTKFTDLGHRLVESIGANAMFTTIDAAGHSAHLERPTSTYTTVEEWIDSRSD